MWRHRNQTVYHHRSPQHFLMWLAAGLSRRLVLGSVFATVCMAAQAMTPYAIGRAIDEGVTSGDQRRIIGWATALFGLAVIQVIAGVLRHFYGTSIRYSASYRTIEELASRLTVLGSGFSRRMSSGAVVSVGVTDINSVGNALNVMLRGSSAVLSIALVSVLMLFTSGRLALVVLVGVPIVVAAMGGLIRPLHDRSAVLRDRQTAMTDRAVDMVSGLRVIRGIGGEETFARRYRVDSTAVRRAGIGTAKVEALAKAAEVLLPGLLVVAIVGLGVSEIQSGRMSPGELVTFYGYAMFLIVPLTTLTEVFNKVVKGFVAARRVVDVLALVEPDGAAGIEGPDGLTLVDPDSGLVAAGGKLTALVCVRAGDVTTLLDRLGRHVESAVSLGGVPLLDLPLDEVRRRILVSTDAARLFAGPLREELDPERRGSGLSEAIRAAAADELIDALPEGLDTVLKPGDGREFSGGQRQRLRLVRALMTTPDILVLVEPTSALDAHTEERVAAGLRSTRLDTSTVVFTTSPALLDRADVVGLVDSGRVVQYGRHRDLLSDQRYLATVGRGYEES